MGAKIPDGIKNIPEKVGNFIKKNWRGFLARLPLPMLAIPASYGVYEFTLLFVPETIAIIQAAAFEAVYVGLAAYDNLTEKDKLRALAISGFAVVASIAYNTLAGMFKLDASLLQAWRQDIVGVVALSVLHGMPLALLAFLVSNFTLHGSVAKAIDKHEETPQAQEQNLLELVENHGQNLPTIVVEEVQEEDENDEDFETEIVPKEDIVVFSEVGFDPRLLTPPSNLPTNLKDAVLLYATHGSYPKAAKFSKYSRETIRTQVAEAKVIAPNWVATVLQGLANEK